MRAYTRTNIYVHVIRKTTRSYVVLWLQCPMIKVGADVADFGSPHELEVVRFDWRHCNDQSRAGAAYEFVTLQALPQ